MVEKWTLLFRKKSVYHINRNLSIENNDVSDDSSDEQKHNVELIKDFLSVVTNGIDSSEADHKQTSLIDNDSNSNKENGGITNNNEYKPKFQKNGHISTKTEETRKVIHKRQLHLLIFK